MIEIKGLSFSYSNQVLFKNAKFDIENGDYVFLYGENGTGKSTFLKILLGFIKPQEGKILINKEKLGYLPQKFDNFNSKFPITINEILSCHEKVIGIKDKTEIDSVLEIVNLRSMKNSLVGELSGGQLQRLFIARSLMGNVKVLILDEPCNNLDHKSEDEMYEILKNLNKEKNITLIVVEHHLKRILKDAKSVLVFEDESIIKLKRNDFMSYINNGGF